MPQLIPAFRIFVPTKTAPEEARPHLRVIETLRDSCDRFMAADHDPGLAIGMRPTQTFAIKSMRRCQFLHARERVSDRAGIHPLFPSVVRVAVDVGGGEECVWLHDLLCLRQASRDLLLRGVREDRLGKEKVKLALEDAQIK